MHHRRSLHRRRPRPHRPQFTSLIAPQPAVARPAEALVPMRSLTLIYHEDFEEEITCIIQEKMLVARYTKIRNVIGARADIIQDSDFEPDGRNHMLIIVATQGIIQELAEAFCELRQMKGHGLRGFTSPVEGLI